MALYQRAPYETADKRNGGGDDMDREQDALAQDAHVQFDDNMDELDRTNSFGGPQDIRAQLEQASQPLEFQATLETKFASYDNYCNLFHFILNSDGPVDLDLPTVSAPHAVSSSAG